MLAAYVAICAVPVLLCFIVLAAIASGAMKTYRTGRRAYLELKPYIRKLSEQGKSAQGKAAGLAQRVDNLTGTVEEIAGRWAFIGDNLKQTRKSPIIRLAESAGKLAGGGKSG